MRYVPDYPQHDILSVVTLSTAHLHPLTRQALSRPETRERLGLVIYDKGEYGWFIYVTDDAYDVMKEARNQKEFDDLTACVIYAREECRCSILCFDRDAEPVDGLAVYEDDEQALGKTTYIYMARTDNSPLEDYQPVIDDGVVDVIDMAVTEVTDSGLIAARTRQVYDCKALFRACFLGDTRLIQKYIPAHHIWQDVREDKIWSSKSHMPPIRDCLEMLE